MFRIDTEDIKKLESDLKTFARRALPFATKDTLNQAAFKTQKISRNVIEGKMILRAPNDWTRRSVQVDQAKTLRISRQSSVVGSTVGYLEDQEFGGLKSRTGKEGVAIPTAYSAGQGQNAQPRTRLPRKANRLRNIRLSGRRTSSSNKQALLMKAQGAVNTGKRNIFHDFGGGKSKGIFKVVGGKRGVKRGWPGNAKLKMLYDMSRSTVRIPRNPWLKPSFEGAQRQLPNMYRKALKFQLRRLGLFDGR